MTLQKPAIEKLQEGLVLDCIAFLPELILTGTIVMLLVCKMFKSNEHSHMGWLALVMTGVALAVAIMQWLGVGALLSPDQFHGGPEQSDMFGGMLVYDTFTIYLRVFLLSFTMLVIGLTLITGIPDKEDSADFYTLVLGATIGMAIMASTRHLLMMFIGIEMASLPSYALAGYLKGRRQSSEAALKYVVYGGGAAGVMLYGISLLAGNFGTAYLPDLATEYAAAVAGPNATFDPVLLLGTLFILVGIAFKLAAVPFHFWCPDVFEGASAEVAGFLSVASKGAAVALLARIVMAFVKVSPDGGALTTQMVYILAVFAIVTATFGNLAAFYQTNLKRLLAYSTIAHAGYMLMALATLTSDGVEAVIFYLAAYLFMNLGAFAVVAFLRNQTGSEDLGSYRGLIRRSPWMVLTLSVFLLSLLGMPPMIGFVAKFRLFASVWNASQEYAATAPGLRTMLIVTLFVGVINSVISAVYYLNVMKVMIIDSRVEDVEGKEPEKLAEPAPTVAYAGVLAAAVFVGLFLTGSLMDAGKSAAKPFQPLQAGPVVPSRTGGGPPGVPIRPGGEQ